MASRSVRTIHFIYPHGPSPACPHAIGVKLAERLRSRYRVLHYALPYPHAIVPQPGDILLGHPDAAAWSVFRRSLGLPGWSRRIGMSPFTQADSQYSYLHRVIPRCDLFLTITGEFWFERIPSSDFAHCAPKMRHLDLAVDRADFPRLKHRFNPPGQRRFLYIGHAGAYKNLGYLDALARRMPGTRFGWIGDRKRPSWHPALAWEGLRDFRRDDARELVASYDFLITVGRADPNPTTILEAMAWGLIPVCTRESGYHRESGVVNVPLDDDAGLDAVIARLQVMPEDELSRLQELNLARIGERFTWDRFATTVSDAIESDAAPAVARASLTARARLWRSELGTPVAPWRYHHLRRALLRRFCGTDVGHPCADPAHCAHGTAPAAGSANAGPARQPGGS
jgi:hypothetical protein